MLDFHNINGLVNCNNYRFNVHRLKPFTQILLSVEVDPIILPRSRSSCIEPRDGFLFSGVLQAAEQRTNRHIAELESDDDKNAEVYNAVTGDFLTENPELGFNSALGPGKIATSLYKGLTPAMRQAIYDEQAKQRVELKVRVVWWRSEGDFNDRTLCCLLPCVDRVRIICTGAKRGVRKARKRLG